VKEKTPVIW